MSDSELKVYSCRFHRNLTESDGIPEFRSIPADSVGIPGFRRNMWGNKKYCMIRRKYFVV